MINGKTFRSSKGSKLTSDEADNNNRFEYVWTNSVAYVEGEIVWHDGVGSPTCYLVLVDTGINEAPQDYPAKYQDISTSLVRVADFASLPVTGEIGKAYLTLDDSALYYWTGSIYTAFTVLVADGSITNAKLADAAANTVKGNATGSSATPTDIALGTSQVLGRLAGDIVPVDILNEGDMASDDPNALATQQSIKAYVDTNGGGGGGYDLKFTSSYPAAADLQFKGEVNFTIEWDSATINSVSYFVRKNTEGWNADFHEADDETDFIEWANGTNNLGDGLAPPSASEFWIVLVLPVRNPAWEGDLHVKLKES